MYTKVLLFPTNIIILADGGYFNSLKQYKILSLSLSYTSVIRPETGIPNTFCRDCRIEIDLKLKFPCSLEGPMPFNSYLNMYILKLTAYAQQRWNLES